MRRPSRRAGLTTGAVLLVLAALAVLTAVSGGPATTAALDPRNPHPSGAQAVARVLAGHDVRVEVARGQRALERVSRRDVDPATTVVVTSADQLSRDTARALRRLTAGAGTLVVVQPSLSGLSGLGLPARPGGTAAGDGTVGAACFVPLVEGLSLRSRGGDVYDPTADEGPDLQGCYGGVLVRTAATPSLPETYLLGGGDVLSNRRVLDADNAAVALRLLGQHQRLVWYVADRDDVPVDDATSVRASLPRFLGPAAWLAVLALLAFALVRGRRLGRVVPEPLPVVVRATESTLSRGRLYRRARDRGHAAGVLRGATRARLLELLALPPHATDPALATAVAERTGRDRHAVDALLSAGGPGGPADPPEPDDRALTRLAQDLSTLEEEVRRS